MKPRLSILIPCYKVENFIRQCLDTIFAIGLPSDEYEVLCFDDQSPDGTLSILNEYTQCHPNLKVVCSDTNVGPGGGRNRLVALAKGEYIWFVDGDDLIIPDLVADLIKKANAQKLDVLVFNYSEWNEDKTKIEATYSMPDTDVSTGLELADKIFDGGLVNNMGYPVRFLIRSQYLIENMISFPENMRYGEDTVWMAKVVLFAQRMMSTSCNAYIYWHHDDSTCEALKRVYPGRTIWEKCILTSLQLIDFVSELTQRYNVTKCKKWLHYAEVIEKYTGSHYVNALPIMLCRTSFKERNIFYNQYLYKVSINKIMYLANKLTRLLMIPNLGYICSIILSAVYKMAHYKYNK